MDFKSEFQTVDLILGSGADTLGVDAFALSLIKAERQSRKIFSFLVYQSNAFDCSNASELITTLANERGVYFDGVINGIDNLSTISVQNLVGADYNNLIDQLNKAKEHRNKIFHGQLTGENLTRCYLLGVVEQIKKWCQLLSVGAMENFGYDGFGRDSFQKSTKQIQLKTNLRNVGEYKQFITAHMTRKR
jgi:hypothetical protein